MSLHINSPFIGYPGRVWAACWQTMNWFIQFMNGGATPAQQGATAAATTFRTMVNGVQAVTAWQIAATLSSDKLLIEQVQALPLDIDAPTAAFLNTRESSMDAAAQQIAALTPPIDLTMVVALCNAGQPGVADPRLVEWCMTFAAETSPAGVLFPDSAVDSASAWLAIAQAIAVLQGSSTTTAYDAAVRMWRASNAAAVQLTSLTSGTFSVDPLDPVAQQLAWNQLVALPSLLTDAAMVFSSPSTLINQQCAVIRNALIAVADQMALLLLSLRKAQLSTSSIASLRNGETLMDLAARTTGDFEDWTAIADVNGLEPPYPSPNNGALIGSALLLSSRGATPPAAGQPIASYAVNVLGTDYDFGHINQTVDGQLAIGFMPQWSGDFQIITGYANFQRAIGRRLQTTLGTLIYHTDYGSRIPPEVGAIQTQDEAVKLAVYATSAIVSDPRTGSIISCSARVTPPFLASVDAVVQPVGPGSTPVSINETLSPLP